MSIEILEYKGKPILKIQEDNMKVPFSFGLRKAGLIIKYLDQIKTFYGNGGKQIDEQNKG